MQAPSRMRALTVAALLAALPLAAACGAAKAATGNGAPSGGAGGGGGSATAASGSVTLAPGASPLCSKAPASQGLVTALNSDQSGWPDPTSATSLSPVPFNQPGQDGWSTSGTEGGRKAIQVTPGQNNGGTNFTYSELYFTTGGVVPSTDQNAMLCLEYYDGPPGAAIALQFSGVDTSGPVNGAYDAAPEVYATQGTNKWLVGSYTMSGINFANGEPGAGAENAHSDFRITGENATPFWVDKAWLVLTNVPAKPDQANMPSPPSAAGG